VSAGPDARTIKADLVRSYDSTAARRDERGEPQWRDKYRIGLAATMRAEQKKLLLEIGAGSGHSAAFFAREGLSVAAIDLSPLNVERCVAKGLDARVADFADLPFPDESFDAIWSMSCFMHAPDAELTKAITEMDRVLISDGIAVVGVWGGDGSTGMVDDDVHDPPRYFAWRTDNQMKAAFGEAFVVERFEIIPEAEDSSVDEHYQLLTMRKP
jgi:SAM-dependent methyltransferase